MGKIIIIGIIIIGIMSVGKWILSNQVDYDVYEENCGEIWNVKSITVKDNSILIEFDINSGSFQGPYMIEDDGVINLLKYGSTFSLKIGEKIGWGDGHHLFASIKLVDIKDKVAFVIIGEEHRPPATHKHLEYNKFRRCKIYGKYLSPALR